MIGRGEPTCRAERQKTRVMDKQDKRSKPSAKNCDSRVGYREADKMVMGVTRKAAVIGALALACSLASVAPASAYNFKRSLAVGDSGQDVRALQVRVAGWYPNEERKAFYLDGQYGRMTKVAITNYQKHHGLKATGVASKSVFEALNRLQDRDGSTEHFDWSEFDQNRNSGCGAQANAYSGTFGGGMVAARKAKRNVKRLMWRLEAVRAKGGSRPVGINSGFRSVPYNNCIGGASRSQHLYGTAADNRMAEITNHRQRKIAMRSQVHGVGCYSSQTHNHFDLRINNGALESSRTWWWPRIDSRGRHLSDEGTPCWGETRHTLALRSSGAILRAVELATPGAGSLRPSAAEIEAFESAGEPEDLNGAD